MKRLLAFLLTFLLMGVSAAQEKYDKEEEAAKLAELPMEALGQGALKIPAAYGRLVTVAVSTDVHYLYFEDASGTIRVVPVGQRAAAQRARAAIQLLAPSAYVIERSAALTLETPPPVQEE